MRSNLLEPMEKSRFFQLVGDFEGLPSILLNINFRVGAKVRQEDMAKQNTTEKEPLLFGREAQRTPQKREVALYCACITGDGCSSNPQRRPMVGGIIITRDAYKLVRACTRAPRGCPHVIPQQDGGPI